MDDIGDLTEEDYGKFKALLKIFVDRSEENRERENRGERVVKPTISRRQGVSWESKDDFREGLGLDRGFDELSDGLAIGMTFFKSTAWNTPSSTYLNIGRPGTEGGSRVNVVPDFEDKSRITGFTVKYCPDMNSNPPESISEPLTRELYEEIADLDLDSEAKPNKAVRDMLDRFVSLHQELEKERGIEMAGASVDGLVCRIERDVLASRNVILHGC